MKKDYNSREFILHIENNVVYGCNGDYILCYGLRYVEKYSQQREDFDYYSSRWLKLCKNLPEGCIVVKSDTYQKKEYERMDFDNHPDTFLHRAYDEHFQGRRYLEHKGYVFFIHPARKTLKNETPINPFRPLSFSFDKKNDLELRSFHSSVEQAIGTMQNYFYPLSESEILSYTDFFFNGFQDNYFCPAKIEKEAISVDNKQIGIFYIPHEKFLPENFECALKDDLISPANSTYVYYEGFMDRLGVMLSSCSHIYNQVIFVDSHQERITELQKQQTNLQNTGYFAAQNKVYAEHLKELLTHAANSEDFRIVRGATMLMFSSETQEEFKHLKNSISSLFKVRDFKPVLATSYNLKEIFLNSFFTNVSGLSNHSLYMTTLQAATGMLISNTRYQSDRQGIFFTDRIDNTPVKYDFWDYDKKRKYSRSFCILAKTGYGKSFLSMHMFYQLRFTGVKQIVLDLGDSYSRMAKLLPANEVAIIKLKKGESIGMNPFTVFQNDKLADKIESISDFIFTILYRTNKPNLREVASLHKILYNYYTNIETGHSLQSFYDFVKDNKENISTILQIDCQENCNDYFNTNSFLHLLSEFVDNGIYSPLMRYDATDDTFQKSLYDKSFIIYELDNISDDLLLIQLSLMAIKETIRRIVWSDRLSPAIIHFEEFAKQMKTPEITLLVEYYTQTVRKYDGAIGLVMQTSNQFPKNSEQAKAILDNISTYLFLDSETADEEAQNLALSSHAITQMKSLQSNFSPDAKYRYSEVYIHHKKGGVSNLVYRVETPYEAFLAYQTEGDLYEIMEILYDIHGDMEKAISSYIREEKKDPGLRQKIRAKYSELQNFPDKTNLFKQYLKNIFV